jgi:nucleotide-binding universal stress UspA family protein
MTLPEHVVFATDLSLTADPSLEVVARIASALHTKVTIFHVFQYVPHHRYQIPVQGMIDDVRHKMDVKLNAIKTRLSALGVDAHVSVVEDGDPSLQILQLLDDIHKPLVVLGTHASAGIERFILGSTAEAVRRQTNHPVVTVGPHVRSTDVIQFRRILLATDFTHDPDNLCNLAMALLHPLCGQLEFLHVVTPDAPEGVAPGFEPMVAAVSQKGLSERQIKLQTLHGKHVAQAVVNEAERTDSELIVLGSRTASEAYTHLAPGVGVQIVSAAPCPVLTIRR